MSKSKHAIGVVIVDDHVVLRNALSLLLNREPDIDVLGEATDAPQGIRVIDDVQPDVVLLDITLPGMSGTTAMPRIKQVCPSAAILVFTMHRDGAILRQALKLGANGYIVKNAADDELVKAIRTVGRGGQYVEQSLATETLTSWISDSEPENVRLSEREQHVLFHIARGYTSKETGQLLRLSPKTVDTYRQRLMLKLDATSRADLVQYAIDHGILTTRTSA